MNRIAVLACTTILVASCPHAAASAVPAILATSREGWVEIDDPVSLQPLARIEVGLNADSVAASADGKMLFITKSLPSTPRGCCALYAIDLLKRELVLLKSPSYSPTVVPNRNLVLTQGSNTSIATFDTKSLQRLVPFRVNGSYDLRPSPDGRWLFGMARSPEPALDIFDLATKQLVHHIKIPFPNFTGTWSADNFYLYALEGNAGHLWNVTPESAQLGDGVPVQIPAFADGLPAYSLAELTGANRHLLLYEVFGMKSDRRSRATSEQPGGVYEIDPKTGAVTNWLVPALHFARLLLTPDGETIYGVDGESLDTWNRPRLVKIERSSGNVQTSRELASDVWNIGLANLPEKSIPQGDIDLTGDQYQ